MENMYPGNEYRCQVMEYSIHPVHLEIKFHD